MQSLLKMSVLLQTALAPETRVGELTGLEVTMFDKSRAVCGSHSVHAHNSSIQNRLVTNFAF
jgi:hypothetical protein